MSRSLIALTIAAFLVVPVATASAGSGDDDRIRAYVSDCIKQVYKPKSITVFCADAGVVIEKIRYRAYGSRTAKGTGTATVNLCEPNCAAGNTETFKVRFKLNRVTQCGDSYQFRRLRMRYVGPKPPGKRVLKQTFACADAPTR